MSLKLAVRPGFLWGSIVFLLLTSTAIFYILKEQEKSLRVSTEKELNMTIEEKKVVENKLVETKKELVAKDEQIKLALDRLKKETTARRQVEADLILIMEAKRALETRLSKFRETASVVELERIEVKPASELVGKVLMVNKEYSFVVIDLGKKDGLQLEDILSVYHNNEFIGKVQVQRLEEEISAVAVLPEWQNVEFSENDKVKKI